MAAENVSRWQKSACVHASTCMYQVTLAAVCLQLLCLCACVLYLPGIKRCQNEVVRNFIICVRVFLPAQGQQVRICKVLQYEMSLQDSILLCFFNEMEEVRQVNILSCF